LLRGLAYQAADDLKDVIFAEKDSGKTGGRDEALGRPNLVVAEGLSAALRRFRRLIDVGDRVQATLPGPPERWLMLEMLKVPMPLSQAEADSSMLLAAI
jgi:geranylgeranyl diphosphate synthase type II